MWLGLLAWQCRRTRPIPWRYHDRQSLVIERGGRSVGRSIQVQVTRPRRTTLLCSRASSLELYPFKKTEHMLVIVFDEVNLHAPVVARQALRSGAENSTRSKRPKAAQAQRLEWLALRQIVPSDISKPRSTRRSWQVVIVVSARCGSSNPNPNTPLSRITCKKCTAESIDRTCPTESTK